MSRTGAAWLRKQLARTFGAQVYNQIVTVTIQLALVPVLLHYWGLEKYGVWLLLSAVPAYLVFADFGFTLSAKNDLTASTAAGDRTRAACIYQSTFALLNAVVAIVIVALLVVVSPANWKHVFSVGEISGDVARQVLLLLSGNVLSNQYLLLFAAGLRASGRPAEEVAWNASSRLAEGMATLVAATQSNDLPTAALAIFLCRTVVVVFVWARLRSIAPWLRLGFRQVKLSEIRRLAAPSFAFVAQSFAQIVLIQGPVILLGSLANPQSIVTFSTCRTLVRLGTTGANLINATIIPEYTRLFSTEKTLLWTTFKWHLLTTAAMVVSYVVVLFSFGEQILEFWTKGVVQAGYPWFFLMILAAAAEMTWTSMAIPVLAINRHIVLSYAYLSISFICLAAIAVTLRTFGLNAVGMSLLCAHTAMLAVITIDGKKHFWREIVR
ncbi:hypothetical protein I6F36_28095 [Bradyrhizobium sp. BRP19]|uniref:lipopolysaccharide biosynthesis protein n=1 Tax=Bradyrhizobium sp. BRP19 TaxID=2793823 RepID=UPI001CD4981C|nr:hypothetical protein [Bradyrhizobium sp. BRP19]MCA1550697.1 hypothetical protein [Bradyrhizobium sp. BRP19]